jgi:phage-related protein
MTTTFPLIGEAVEPIGESTVPDFRGSRFAKNEPETRKIIGLNQFLRTWVVQLKPLQIPDSRTITEYLRARTYRNQWFYWTHPKHGLKKVRCKSWTVELLGESWFEIQLQLTEVI